MKSSVAGLSLFSLRESISSSFCQKCRNWRLLTPKKTFSVGSFHFDLMCFKVSWLTPLERRVRPVSGSGQRPSVVPGAPCGIHPDVDGVGGLFAQRSLHRASQHRSSQKPNRNNLFRLQRELRRHRFFQSANQSTYLVRALLYIFNLFEGTLVRVFETTQRTLIAEFRRGADTALLYRFVGELVASCDPG